MYLGYDRSVPIHGTHPGSKKIEIKIMRSRSSAWVLNLNLEINLNDLSQVVDMLHVLPTEVTLNVTSIS